MLAFDSLIMLNLNGFTLSCYEVGMLWTGEGPDAKALEESMATYSNLLQGFLLLSHGSMIGAGTTLSSCIHASVKQVIDCSFMLLRESVASFGNLSILSFTTHA